MRLTTRYAASSDPETEDPMQTIRQIAEIVNPTGSVGVIGAYFDDDPGGVDPHATEGRVIGSQWASSGTRASVKARRR
jgi:glutathione-independent formaldehyde dehydrogenase